MACISNVKNKRTQGERFLHWPGTMHRPQIRIAIPPRTLGKEMSYAADSGHFKRALLS